ncbi:hypothetical protein [Mesobacillus boroniphilus]|uniref:Uncharacterized protein n=1 Tax=Mesobacillus boroniphilus JCM 21738 TaxID=1294265 RepID=W4RTY3_9BACI|nr:hypothetical protein [Mesobacillus boroniphilus]GAE47104.1 hypothetical protein JCM21738_4050 [Mesobacillus boroniphilus JCM 21738]
MLTVQISQTSQTTLAGNKQPGEEQRSATTVEALGNRFASCSIIRYGKYIVISL